MIPFVDLRFLLYLLASLAIITTTASLSTSFHYRRSRPSILSNLPTPKPRRRSAFVCYALNAQHSNAGIYMHTFPY